MNEDNLDVAITIANEAGGEGYLGMLAVACVIANRCRQRNQTPLEVVLAPKQFSCWTQLTPEQRQTNYEAVQDTVDKLAADLLSHFDITKGATNYLTLNLYNSSDCPSWADQMQVCFECGHHVFLKQA